MSILKSVTSRRSTRLGAIVTLTAASIVALSTTSSQAAGSGLTPSVVPDNKATVLVLTGTGFKDPSGTTVLVDTTGANFGVSYVSTTCASVNTKALPYVSATNRNVVSATRLSLTLPAIDVTTKTDFNLCVYKTGGPLLATAKFSVYPAPTATAISAAEGPTVGGQTISVTGTNFTSKTTATLNGAALTKMSVAKDGLSFTAVTPPSATAGAATFTISNEGGDVAGPAYAYDWALTSVSPSSVPIGGTVITVRGTGFKKSLLTVANGGTALAPAVYLVRGSFDHLNLPADSAAHPGGACGTLQVISDTEFTCVTPTIAAAAGPAGPGAYDVYATSNSGADNAGTSLTSGDLVSVGVF